MLLKAEGIEIFEKICDGKVHKTDKTAISDKKIPKYLSKVNKNKVL